MKTEFHFFFTSQLSQETSNLTHLNEVSHSPLLLEPSHKSTPYIHKIIWPKMNTSVLYYLSSFVWFCIFWNFKRKKINIAICCIHTLRKCDKLWFSMQNFKSFLSIAPKSFHIIRNRNFGFLLERLYYLDGNYTS